MKPPPKALAHLVVSLATLLGSASLLLLLAFLVLGSFHLLDLGLSSATALALDALLSAAFFTQHSGMVRRAFRERLGRVVPRAFHGPVYTVASSLVLVLCLALWQRVGAPVVHLEGAASWVLRALSILAIAGFAWGARALGSFDTFGVGPVLALARGIEPQDRPFSVKGPYRFVRHPLYFFALVLFWGCPVMTADRLLFNVLWTVWVVLATVLEERDLVADFGDSYVRYQQEVPMIVPWRIVSGRPVGSSSE